MTAFRDLTLVLIANQTDPDFKDNYAKLQGALVSLLWMLDVDGNRMVGRAGLIKLGGRVFTVFFDFLNTTLVLAKKVLKSVTTPALGLCLDIKRQILGGVNQDLTHADLSCVALCIGIAEQDPNFIGFAVEILSSANDGLVTSKDLENLCRPILRLAIMSPEARISVSDTFRY